MRFLYLHLKMLSSLIFSANKSSHSPAGVFWASNRLQHFIHPLFAELGVSIDMQNDARNRNIWNVLIDRLQRGSFKQTHHWDPIKEAIYMYIYIRLEILLRLIFVLSDNSSNFYKSQAIYEKKEAHFIRNPNVFAWKC